jgi:hypothetical protein
MASPATKTVEKTKSLFESLLFVVLGLTISVVGLTIYGCSLLRYIPPEKLSYAELSVPYTLAQLKVSNTLDVLSSIQLPQSKQQQKFIERQILSQSDTVIAASGRSKDGHKMWLNMFAFDEHTMTTKRKCFFCVDEKATMALKKPRRYFIPPRHGLIIDCQTVLDPEMLAKPYSNEEARRIEILKNVAQALHKDTDELRGTAHENDRQEDLFSILAMMINQVFDAVLLELDRSPGAAAGLSDENGISFSHITFDKGRIQMFVIHDIVTIKIRMGYPMQ